MTTTTLTRSKLVTREIKETMLYTPFGKDMIAIKVDIIVAGVDPFKSEHYALMDRSTFDKAMKEVAKSKSDFPYRELIITKNQSYQWHFATAGDMKRFKEFPDDEQMSNNLYAFVTGGWESEEKLTNAQREAIRAAQTKKAYNNAITKNGKNLFHFNHSDHTSRTADGKLIPVPMHIDYGLRSGEFKMKKMVTALRELDCVHMRVQKSKRGYSNAPDAEYPEIVGIPHYNAEFDGETEISLWFLPTEEQYNDLRGGKEYVSMGVWEILNRNLLPIAEFKKERDDD